MSEIGFSDAELQAILDASDEPSTSGKQKAVTTTSRKQGQFGDDQARRKKIELHKRKEKQVQHLCFFIQALV